MAFGIIGSILGGITGGKASERAQNAQTAAADKALNFEKQVYKQNRKDQQPYRQAGVDNLPRLNDELNRISTASAQQDPIIGRQNALLEGDVNAIGDAANASNPAVNRQLQRYEGDINTIDKASAPNAQLGAEVNALSNLTNDPNAQRDFITKNPFYGALSNQATQAVFANQAAKGKIGSGGTASALQENLLALGSGLLNQNLQQRQGAIGARSDMVNDDFTRLLSGANARSQFISDADGLQNQNLARLSAGADARQGLIANTDNLQTQRINRLNTSLAQRQNLTALGQNAAAQTGAQSIQSAGNISTILGQRGNAQAAGIQGRNTIRQNTANDISSGLMLAALCDERMKEDAILIGHMDDGLPVYQFRYKGKPGRHVGVMAQEVEKVKPHAVIERDGLKYVNYGAL